MASKDIMQFVNGLHKRGNDSFYDAVQAASAKQLQHQALSNAGMLGAVGLGVGAGGRGIAGLLQLVSRNMKKQPRSLPKPITIDLPIHETEEEPKTASMSDFLKGDYAQSVSGVPWAIPAAIGAGTAGVAGGWKAMDYLMDKRRKGDLDIELDKAKKEYEQALEENNHLKTAGFNKVAQALNTLCDTIEQKTASMADGLGTAAGLYGLYGGVSGLAAATLAYNWGKKRQRKAIVERALKERRKRRFNSQPATVYARPLATPKATPPAMQTAPPEENTLEGLDI